VTRRISISVPGNAAIPWLVGGGVHGSAGPLQQIDGLPCTDLVGLRGTSVSRFRLKARQPNSFSFSIPTPVLFEDVRPRLSRVYIVYKLDDSARVSRLSVMDGPNELLHLQFSPSERYLAGEGPSITEAAGGTMTSWDVPNSPELRWGVGIGLIIDPIDGDAEVTFVSAGVELELEPAQSVAS
jgi:hypothetical protein